MGRGNLTLFHVRGIRVGVDYSWFVVLFLVIIWLSSSYKGVLGSAAGDTEPYLLAVTSALALFGSILLHELGHAFVAMRNGIAITEITLWLFGGVARMSREADSAGVEFRVAAAGPAVTLAISLVCGGTGALLADSGDGFLDAFIISGGSDVSGVVALLGFLASINAVVLVINLIPALPLDGGRIARAIAWRLTGDRNRATRFAASLGRIFAYLFVGLGLLLFASGDVFGGIWLALIGVVLGGAARGAAAQGEFTKRIEGIRIADVMDAEPIAIPEDATVQRALDEYFLRYRWPWFPVVDAAERYRGLIELDTAEDVPEATRSERRVGEIFEADAAGTLQIRADAPLEAVLANETLRRLGALPAVDDDGRLSGVVTIEHVGRTLRDAVTGATDRDPGANVPD